MNTNLGEILTGIRNWATNKFATSTHNHSGVYQPVGNYIVEGDSRLTGSRPASDVQSWAKATNKPTYASTELTDVSCGVLNSESMFGSGGIQGSWEKRGDYIYVFAIAQSISGWDEVFYQLPYASVDPYFSSWKINDYENTFKAEITVKDGATAIRLTQHNQSQMTYNTPLLINIKYKYK